MEMIKREKVIKELESLRDICNAKSNMAIGNGKVAWAGYANAAEDAIVLLKEQEAMNVDTFVQWCIDNHIMGDATVRGIKYWVEKYKKTKESR